MLSSSEQNGSDYIVFAQIIYKYEARPGEILMPSERYASDSTKQKGFRLYKYEAQNGSDYISIERNEDDAQPAW